MIRLPMIPGRALVIGAVVTAALVLPGFLSGNGGVAGAEDSTSKFGIVPTAPQDTLMTLIVPRTDEMIRADLTEAHGMDAAASADVAQAKTYLSQVKAQIEVKKSEIKTTEAEIKLANQQERKIEKENLERRKKIEDLVLRMLEKRRELRETEIEMAQARQDYAEAAVAYHEVEIQLNTKRSQWETFRIGGEVKNAKPLTSLQRDTQELEKKALDALKKAAEKREQFAQKEKQQVERRLAVFEAQKSFLEGTR